MQPGQIERRTPDYCRHGKGHRPLFYPAWQRAVSRIPDLIDASVPAHLEVHLVLDNYATHKTKIIKRWLVRWPRYHLHFTPT